MFGSWNSKVKQMTVDIGKADFQFVPRSAGYIKQTADDIAGPPVIVYNHRQDQSESHDTHGARSQYRSIRGLCCVSRASYLNQP